MNKKTTQAIPTTVHQLTMIVIEKTINDAARRLREGTAILPEPQDAETARQVITKLLDGEDKQLKAATQQLIDIYMFTLAQATSAMVSLFNDDTSSDMEE